MGSIYQVEKDMTLIQNLTFDYALYIMFTSYFRKSTCNSNQAITRLKLNYADVGYNKQYEAEDVVIDKLENEILLQPEFSDIENYDVDVKLDFIQEEKRYLHTMTYNGKIIKAKVIPYYDKEEKAVKANILIEQ